MSVAMEASSDFQSEQSRVISSVSTFAMEASSDFQSEQSRVISSAGTLMSLVARTGRHQQRYEHGYRLVAGCVPFRHRSDSACNGNVRQILEVLMVTTQGGPGLLFPKGGWETDETVEEAACREAFEEAGVNGQLKGYLGYWDFKSKHKQGGSSPEGLCRAYMFALVVTKELNSWPEQNSRQRKWVTVSEAFEHCRYDWMRRVLEKCIPYLMSSSLASGEITDSPSADTALPPRLPVKG